MTNTLWVTPEELGDLADSEYALEAAQTASYLLWAMSGRKFSGIRSITEDYSPVDRATDPRTLYSTSSAVLVGRLMSSSPLPVGPTKIRLRGQPVRTIDAVQALNGDAYPEDGYSLVNHKYLQFPGIVGTVRVTYTYGAEPPTAGRMAARKLAREFALLWEGSNECSLPDRVTSVSREGISYTILDNQDFIQQLRTGVYEVDLFLKTVNPNGASRRARVISPDLRRANRG